MLSNKLLLKLNQLIIICKTVNLIRKGVEAFIIWINPVHCVAFSCRMIFFKGETSRLS